ncbi:MAG: A/G-specific adenine glycosylase [Hyphomonadaceae bacterium]
MINRDRLRKALLAWYDRSGRTLPWRVRKGRADPYKVWLSEIMLQQTTVSAAGPYYQRFLDKFPTVQRLADARREDVLAAWAGLGYYSRARNLHAAAVALDLYGFPETEAGWRALPGVGTYTAAAVAAIAFDRPANVVDGNVERVMARLFAAEQELPGAKKTLRDLAARFVTDERPGDYAQALMDLGATVCTPSSPKCALCPWTEDCAARASGAPETYPRRAPKAARPERFGAVYRLEKRGKVWLVRRPDQGLLGGMAALPTSEWRASPLSTREAVKAAPAKAQWRMAGAVRHVFTHFALSLDVWSAEAEGEPAGEGWWEKKTALDALPSVFKKAAARR